jgi:hypothetical protein
MWIPRIAFPVSLNGINRPGGFGRRRPVAWFVAVVGLITGLIVLVRELLGLLRSLGGG